MTPADIRTVEIVANEGSGSVEAGAAEAALAIAEERGLKARSVAARPETIEAALKAAVEARPDLVAVIAGDGTARAAAALCGADGPLLAPLPGGTMNMLPKALYGQRAWPDALRDSLDAGEVRPVGGGEVDGRTFHCAAILGAPALFAYAREEIREGHVLKAAAKARYALERAFTSRLRLAVEGGGRHKAEAAALICPLVSKAVEDEAALEVAILDPGGAAEAFRLGFKALAGDVFGDWRLDPAVRVERARAGRAWASHRIPAILDGEPVRLPRSATFRFRREAFRALAPKPPEAPEI